MRRTVRAVHSRFIPRPGSWGSNPSRLSAALCIRSRSHTTKRQESWYSPTGSQTLKGEGRRKCLARDGSWRGKGWKSRGWRKDGRSLKEERETSADKQQQRLKWKKHEKGDKAFPNAATSMSKKGYEVINGFFTSLL